MFTQKNIKEVTSYMLPLLAWMGVIFCFSAVPGPAESYWNWKVFIERKSAHVGEFAILAWLALRVFSLMWKKNIKRILLDTLLFSMLVAISDEVHQLFVFGREGRVQDVGFDMLGVCGVLLFIWILARRKLIK